MSNVIIKSYPVKGGDCFLIKYEGKNFLIDSGYKTTSDRLINDLQGMSDDGEKLDLLIITHIDNDHIGGAIRLLEAEKVIPIDEIWYNGYLQVFDIKEDFKRTDRISELKIKNIISSNGQSRDEDDANYQIGYDEAKSLEESLFNKKVLINNKFNGKAISSNMKYSFDDRDIEFRFLSPSTSVIDDLKEEWKSVLEKCDYYGEERNIVYMPKAFEFYYKNDIEVSNYTYEMSSKENEILDVETLSKDACKLDDKIINRSSLAFMLRIKDKNLLFLGDSNPADIEYELKKLIDEDERYRNISLMKVSHHGSKYNTNNPLLSLVNIESFLISTDGSPIKDGVPSKPHLETIAKILYNEPQATLFFNYPKSFYSTNIHELISNWNSKKENNNIVKFGNVEEPLKIEIKL